MLMKRLVSDTSTVEQNPTVSNNLDRTIFNSNRTRMKDKRQISNENKFLLLYIAMQAVGLLMLITLLIWIVDYYGGFSWSDINLRFNFHPILMILGMVYLSGNSILAFRVLKEQPKPLVKIVHASLHITAFTTALIGAIAVFTNHFGSNKPNLYSLHSWIGFSTTSLFFTQYVGGFCSFLYPKASGQFRAALLPYHVLGGFAIFCLALMSALTGLAEKMAFDVGNYANFSGRMWWLNFTGMFVIAFGFLVIYLGTERSFKKTVTNSEHLPLNEPFREETGQNLSPN